MLSVMLSIRQAVTALFTNSPTIWATEANWATEAIDETKAIEVYVV